jgi:hypothetical protein
LALMFYNDVPVALAGEPLEIFKSVGERVIASSSFDELAKLLRGKMRLGESRHAISFSAARFRSACSLTNSS